MVRRCSPQVGRIKTDSIERSKEMHRKVGWLVVLVMVVALLLAGCKSVGPADGVAYQEGDGNGAEELTAEYVAAAVAVVVSLLLEVVPGLAEQWNSLDETTKRLAWLAGCLVIPLAIVGAGCAGLDLGVIAPGCDAEGVVEALKVGFAGYFAGQVAYMVVSKRVRKAKVAARQARA